MTNKYCFKSFIGAIGDMTTEWWTEEDWKRHKENIKELRVSGEYGKEIEICYELEHCPALDDPQIIFNTGKDKSTAQFLIFDVANDQ